MTTYNEKHIDSQHNRLVDLDSSVVSGDRRELELAFVLERSGGAAPAGAKIPIKDRHCNKDGIRAEVKRELHLLEPLHHQLPARFVNAAPALVLEVVEASRGRRR